MQGRGQKFKRSGNGQKELCALRLLFYCFFDYDRKLLAALRRREKRNPKCLTMLNLRIKNTNLLSLRCFLQ